MRRSLSWAPLEISMYQIAVGYANADLWPFKVNVNDHNPFYFHIVTHLWLKLNIELEQMQGGTWFYPLGMDWIKAFFLF